MTKHTAWIHVVEDDDGEREALRFLFDTDGYRVATYATAEELVRATIAPPACIVTDLMMGRMDGLELLSSLQKRSGHIPVIMITAYADVSKAVAAMKYGAFEFVEKPYDPALLLSCVEQALQISRRQAAAFAERDAAQRLLQRLTRREREIFDRLVDGLPNKTIAQELAISDRTVESHRASITRKLGVSGLAGLIAIARRASGPATVADPALLRNCSGRRAAPRDDAERRL